MSRQRPVSKKKPEAVPTLFCPHCHSRLTEAHIEEARDFIHGNVILKTRPAKYPCHHCGIIIKVDIALEEPKPEVVDFGIHYVGKDFVLKPLP